MNNNTTFHPNASITSRSTLTHNTSYQLLVFFVAVILTNGAGVLANILLLLAMAIYRPLRRSSSCVLLVHCLLIDLVTAAVSTPLGTIPLYLGPSDMSQLGRNFCKYVTLVLYLPIACSMYASSVLAVHRLIAAVLPNHFAFLTRKIAITCMIIFPWLVGLIINVLPVFEIGKKYVRSAATGACVLLPVPLNTTTQIVLSTVFGYYVPTAVIGVSYVIVLVKTVLAIRRHGSSLRLQRRLEISRTLMISFVWHCVTAYPTLIVLTFFPREYGGNLALQLVLKYFGSSYSAGNPVFFLASSRMYQEGAKKVLKCQWWRGQARRVGDDFGRDQTDRGKSGFSTRQGSIELRHVQRRPVRADTGTLDELS